MDFNYATVRTASSALFGTDVDIGKGITDLLVDKLVNDGTFSVIERKALKSVLDEQNRSISDRFDSSAAAQIGRLLGVDAIVIGSVTQFGRDDGGGGGGWRAPGVDVGVRRGKAKAVVGITARIVNVDTGEILAGVTGKGKSKRKGLDLFGGGGAINMGSSNFAQTIIGEAVYDAVNSVAAQLHANSYKVTARPLKIDGLVAYVDGDELIMNVGSKAGVEVGAVLVVGRVTREDRDPNTGAVIRRTEEELGYVKITKVEALSSVGKHSGAPVKVKDRVHN